MELKVWCDGIQRVVCGVSSSTTCQEVVFALAHATAQTGRFILIEKWRNSERLLAPTEHPLQVLSKWGEYANDVTFVMKRSEQNTNKTNFNLNNSFNTSQTSAATNNTNPLTTTGAAVGIANGSPNRKFLLFNSNNNNINKKSGFVQQNSVSTLPSIAKSQTTTPTNNSNPSLTPNASPLKSNSCLNSSHNNTNNNVNNNQIDSSPNLNDLTPTKQLSQQMNNKNINNTSNESPTPTKQSSANTQHRPRHPPPYSEAINMSALITGTGSTSTSSSHMNALPADDRSVTTNKRRSIEPSPQTQSKQRTSAQQKELLLHRDAVRLCDLQKETMRTQEKEMSSLEQQISCIEKKLLENELLIKRYKEEMECCHQIWLDQEVMIDQLDQQLIDQELDELVNTAKCYEEEVVSVKKKLSSCEADIGDCRQKITKLMDELEENDRIVKLDELEKEENERQLTEQLRLAIRDKNKDLETQKSELQTLTNNIQQLDSVLSEKSSEVDRLLSELKEANIQGLALLSSDESHKLSTNSRQPFQQRSGSTRRIIGSPRELENAVATNKNPHGVWV